MAERETLQLVITGHVDHGKSTLIGRLSVDTDSLASQRIEELRAASGGEIDYAYVTDQLEEERTQSMTIDTAQAFFRTGKRDYVIIDAPGHKEFTRHMITGASRAEAAVLVVDATEGLREQTRRHAYFVAMLGIGQLAVLVNKMDIAGYDEGVFGKLKEETEDFLASLGLSADCVIPGSAMQGDNVVARSEKTGWYSGPTVVEALDSFSCLAPDEEAALRFPVQDVYRADGEAIVVGRVESGRLAAGQELTFLPSGARARVKEVRAFGEDRTTAEAGRCVGIVLAPAIEVERGEVGCLSEEPAEATGLVRANVFSLAPAPLRVGGRFMLRAATQEIPCTVERIEERIDSSTLAAIEEDAEELAETEVGRVVLRLERPGVVESFQRARELGRIVLARGNDVIAGGIVTDAGEAQVEHLRT